MNLSEIVVAALVILLSAYTGYKILQKSGVFPVRQYCSFCGKEIADPLTCDYCHQKFCREHQHPFVHTCTESRERFPLYENCSVCGKRTYLPYRCHYCQKFFCGDHHLPFNHNCENIEDWKTSPGVPEMSTMSENGNVFGKR
jgi:predicted nucleic acid binding AN1-type Zn finger protein